MDFENFISPNSKKKLILFEKALIYENEEFPILNGISRFVDNNNYSEAFGLQWNTFKKTQFDSETKTAITETRLEEALGQPLTELNGKKILEAGSGAGRFTEVLLKYGAVVYSFDFSNAIEANYDNNMPNDQLTLFQADALNIPLPDNMFDYVIALGMLQHTPSTKKSLKELYRVLKPGGLLTCDHYRFQRGMYTSLYLVWWIIIKQFNPSIQMKITNSLTKLFFPGQIFILE